MIPAWESASPLLSWRSSGTSRSRTTFSFLTGVVVKRKNLTRNTLITAGLLCLLGVCAWIGVAMS